MPRPLTAQLVSAERDACSFCLVRFGALASTPEQGKLRNRLEGRGHGLEASNDEQRRGASQLSPTGSIAFGHPALVRFDREPDRHSATITVESGLDPAGVRAWAGQEVLSENHGGNAEF